MEQVETSTSLGLHESQTQVRSGSTSEEGRATSSFRIPHGPLPSQTLRARATCPKLQGSVVLRGDNVKGDSGYNAVFTKQGASASQVAVAKFLDTMSRLRGMAGVQVPVDYEYCWRKSAHKCG